MILDGKHFYDLHRTVGESFGFVMPMWSELSDEQKAAWEQHAFDVETKKREDDND